MAHSGDTMPVGNRSNSNGGYTSGDGPGRGNEGESEGIGTSRRGDPSGCACVGGRGRCRRGRLGDPSLVITHTFGTTRSCTAFHNANHLRSATISLNVALVAESAATVAGNGQGTELVVWNGEILCNGKIDWGWRWLDHGSALWGDGGSNPFGQGRLEPGHGHCLGGRSDCGGLRRLSIPGSRNNGADIGEGLEGIAGGAGSPSTHGSGSTGRYFLILLGNSDWLDTWDGDTGAGGNDGDGLSDGDTGQQGGCRSGRN